MSKKWYQYKMKSGYIHRSNRVEEEQKVWLTDKQAEGLMGLIAECEAPETIFDCAAPFDYAFYQESLKANAELLSKEAKTETETDKKSLRAGSRAARGGSR